MALQCLTWIPELWVQLVNSATQKRCRFPDNVVFEILIRLPPESVKKCRKVCKQWLEITSSPYFVDMHHHKTSSILVVQIMEMRNTQSGEFKLIIFDEDSKKLKRMNRGWVAIKEGCWAPRLVGCCNTKLVLMSMSKSGRYYLCSLLTREIVVVEPPQPSVYIGIFFHPTEREYMVLFYRQVRNGLEFETFMYSCGSKMWRELPAISYRPCYRQNLVELNGNLHWVAISSVDDTNGIASCRNSIIVFNTSSERFSFMPHPRPGCAMWLDHMKMYLLSMRGLLCFGKVFNTLILVWALEDYENWSWTLRYKIGLNWGVERFPFSSGYVYNNTYSRIRLWNIKNNELMISWSSRGLFRYNFEHNIVEKVGNNELCFGFLVTLDLSH